MHTLRIFLNICLNRLGSEAKKRVSNFTHNIFHSIQCHISSKVTINACSFSDCFPYTCTVFVDFLHKENIGSIECCAASVLITRILPDPFCVYSKQMAR